MQYGSIRELQCAYASAGCRDDYGEDGAGRRWEEICPGELEGIRFVPTNCPCGERSSIEVGLAQIDISVTTYWILEGSECGHH